MNGGSRRGMMLVLGVICLIASVFAISAGLRGGPRPASAPVTPAPSPRTSASAQATAVPSPSPSPAPSAPSATPTASASPTQPPATSAPATAPPTAAATTPTPAATAAPATAAPAANGPAARARSTPPPATARPTSAPTRAPARPAATPTAESSQTFVGGKPNDACLRALTYITTAANERITRQAVYNAARAGLEENEHCPEPRRSVNEGYLLAMLAPAEYSLGRGDWKRDLDRSNLLLEACVHLASFAGTEIADDCAKQRSYNDTIRSIIERQSARRGS